MIFHIFFSENDNCDGKWSFQLIVNHITIFVKIITMIFFCAAVIKMIQFKKIVLSEPEVQVFKLLSEV